MVDVLIPREPIPVALTAEQVVAYLLRPGSGWREDIGKDATGYYRIFKRGDEAVSFATYGRGKNRAHWLTRCILDIARAESRPAEQVVADIAEPVVGVGGVGCEPSPGDRKARFRCILASWSPQKRRRGLINLIEWATMPDDEDVAPRAPVEE